MEGRTGSSPLSIICRALTGRERSETPALLCPLTCVITARLAKSSTRPATSTLLMSISQTSKGRRLKTENCHILMSDRKSRSAALPFGFLGPTGRAGFQADQDRFEERVLGNLVATAEIALIFEIVRVCSLKIRGSPRGEPQRSTLRSLHNQRENLGSVSSAARPAEAWSSEARVREAQILCVCDCVERGRSSSCRIDHRRRRILRGEKQSCLGTSLLPLVPSTRHRGGRPGTFLGHRR